MTMSGNLAQSAARAESARHGTRLRGRLPRQSRAVSVLAVLVVLFVATGFHNHLFWGANNVKVLLMGMSFVAIAGTGTALLLITGNIDLSIGSLLALTAVSSAMLSKVVPVPLALLLGVMIGGGVGALNGLVVWNVPTSPIIITLGSLSLIRGIVLVMTRGEAVGGAPHSYLSFGNSEPLGLPMPVWIFIVVALLGFIFLTFTTTGRHIYAIGGNKETSRSTGIRVRRIVIGAFLINGLLVGLAGVLEGSLYGAPEPTYGLGFELEVITAVIVGGISFAGGEGGVLRAMLGCALIAVINGAVVSWNINPDFAEIATGAILVLAVSSDHLMGKRRERYQRIMAMREQAQIALERRSGDPPPDVGDQAEKAPMVALEAE